MFGFGAGSSDADFTGWALMTLSLGLVPFTLQYVCLRAFYALENTRTPFFLQLLITGCYVTLGVLVSTLVDSNPLVAACLGSGLALAYLIGVIVSTRVLRRSLPDLAVRPLARLGGRLLLAFAPGMAVAAALVWGVESISTRASSAVPWRSLGAVADRPRRLPRHVPDPARRRGRPTSSVRCCGAAGPLAAEDETRIWGVPAIPPHDPDSDLA